jgi:hypothetical protein
LNGFPLPLSQRARRALNARDVERINGSAAQLNTEAEDVLDYQFMPESDSEL